MSSFPTDEHRKFAKQMEASYNEIIPDNLDQVPTSLLHIYGPSKDPLDTLYISFLHFKHLMEQRHCFLISRHHSIQLKLLHAHSQMESILHQNRTLFEELQTIKQLLTNSNNRSSSLPHPSINNYQPAFSFSRQHENRSIPPNSLSPDENPVDYSNQTGSLDSSFYNTTSSQDYSHGSSF